MPTPCSAEFAADVVKAEFVVDSGVESARTGVPASVTGGANGFWDSNPVVPPDWITDAGDCGVVAVIAADLVGPAAGPELPQPDNMPVNAIASIDTHRRFLFPFMSFSIPGFRGAGMVIPLAILCINGSAAKERFPLFKYSRGQRASMSANAMLCRCSVLAGRLTHLYTIPRSIFN